MSTYDELLHVAVEAVERAADLMRHQLPGVITAKGDRDMATEVDFLIERETRALLRNRTPGIRFLGEEEGTTGDGEMLWTLDPIDGTVNFLHGLPMCAVSLGLVHQKRPVLGVISLPFLGGLYTAVQNQGAYVDGRRIWASNADNPNEAVVSIGDYAVGVDAERKNRLRLAVTQQLAKSVLRVRMNGSAATDLVWLAEGKLDASITLSNNPWDTSAGVVIAREAGAVVVDRNGSDHTFDSTATVACAPALVPRLLSVIRQAEKETAPERQTSTEVVV